MSRVKELVREFIIVASFANPNIDREKYLSLISDNDAENYNLFYSFACACSSTLLALLYNSGKIIDNKLLQIVREIITIRRDFGEEVEDVWGLIGNTLAANRSILVSFFSSSFSDNFAHAGPSRGCKRRAEEAVSLSRPSSRICTGVEIREDAVREISVSPCDSEIFSPLRENNIEEDSSENNQNYNEEEEAPSVIEVITISDDDDDDEEEENIADVESDEINENDDDDDENDDNTENIAEDGDNVEDSLADTNPTDNDDDEDTEDAHESDVRDSVNDDENAQAVVNNINGDDDDDDDDDPYRVREFFLGEGVVEISYSPVSLLSGEREPRPYFDPRFPPQGTPEWEERRLRAWEEEHRIEPEILLITQSTESGYETDMSGSTLER